MYWNLLCLVLYKEAHDFQLNFLYMITFVTCILIHRLLCHLAMSCYSAYPLWKSSSLQSFSEPVAFNWINVVSCISNQLYSCDVRKRIALINTTLTQIYWMFSSCIDSITSCLFCCVISVMFPEDSQKETSESSHRSNNCNNQHNINDNNSNWYNINNTSQ